MYSLVSISDELIELEPLLVEYLLTPNEPTNQILRHIFESGGKRIRPALFLLACKAIGYNKVHKHPIASVCEYIHTASLLHDDVIDSSTLRRGKPTANSIWGDESAVLAGDLIYSAACRLMVKSANLPLIDTFAECIRFMSESELYQLELLWKKDTTEAQYNRVVDGKTAALFEAACCTACFLNDEQQALIECFRNFGKHLGFAFQIADDCLDYEGSEHEVGKSVMADLTEGKVTLPLIFALRNSDSESNALHKSFHTSVESLLDSGDADPKNLQTLINGVKDFNGVTEAKQTAKDHCLLGLSCLNQAQGILKDRGDTQQKEISQRAFADLASIIHFVVDRRK